MIWEDERWERSCKEHLVRAIEENTLQFPGKPKINHDPEVLEHSLSFLRDWGPQTRRQGRKSPLDVIELKEKKPSSLPYQAKVAENSDMSQFKPGQEKPLGSGRKSGIPNKKTKVLAEILENNNFDLTERLLKLLPKLKPEKQAEILLELMTYVFPKRKAIEGSDSSETQKTVVHISIPSNDREANLNLES